MGNILEIDGFRIPVGSHKGKNLIIGADHRGYDYKKGIIESLEDRYSCMHVLDVGTYSDARCDYPGISNEIGKMLSKYPDFGAVGIGICGSGIGILIPAGKHNGVYVARCLNPKEAETSRKHNNTNMLGIGADYTDFDIALETVTTWMETPFFEDPKTEKAYFKRFLQTVRLEQ